MHQHVLVTGLMGSGKSTLLLEYMLNFKTIEFTKPPIEASFEGQDFEFLDNIFAIRRNDDTFNFYELDAPTIKKWTQFISAANGIIIVSNHNPQRVYSTPEDLLSSIIEFAPQAPVLFVATNYDDFEAAKKKIEDDYKVNRIPNNNYHIEGIGKGKEFFDEVYGQRYILEPERLKIVIDWHLNRKSN